MKNHSNCISSQDFTFGTLTAARFLWWQQRCLAGWHLMRKAVERGDNLTAEVSDEYSRFLTQRLDGNWHEVVRRRRGLVLCALPSFSLRGHSTWSRYHLVKVTGSKCVWTCEVPDQAIFSWIID